MRMWSFLSRIQCVPSSRDCVPGPALLTAALSEKSVGRDVRLSSMRELARLPGFLLAELLGRLVANALVALLGWASDQLMHHVRYASPAVDTENLWRGTYGVSTATPRWFVSLTAEMPGSLRMPSTDPKQPRAEFGLHPHQVLLRSGARTGINLLRRRRHGVQKFVYFSLPRPPEQRRERE